MNVIPRKNRNTRYSMQDSVNRNLGLDRLRDPQKMPGFQELLAQEGVEQLLKSIIDARFDKMDITKEFLAQMESDDSPFAAGLPEPRRMRKKRNSRGSRLHARPSTPCTTTVSATRKATRFSSSTSKTSTAR